MNLRPAPTTVITTVINVTEEAVRSTMPCICFVIVDSLAELDAGTDNGDQQPDGGGNDRPTTNATKNAHTAPPALPPPTGGPQRLLAVGSKRLRSPSAQLAKELLGQMAYSLVVVRRTALAGHPGATAQPVLEAGSALLPSRRDAPS